MREEDEKRVMDATGLLRAWSEGDPAALNELVPLVERELHQLARAYMGRERQDHTLQATALVNEVFLRLARGATPDWKNRGHFVGIAARLMRQVLVDHARSRRRSPMPSTSRINAESSIAT
jgi:RNA polymerase sigma factor (TIGR02999 family)